MSSETLYTIDELRRIVMANPGSPSDSNSLPWYEYVGDGKYRLLNPHDYPLIPSFTSIPRIPQIPTLPKISFRNDIVGDADKSNDLTMLPKISFPTGTSKEIPRFDPGSYSKEHVKLTPAGASPKVTSKSLASGPRIRLYPSTSKSKDLDMAPVYIPSHLQEQDNFYL